ncbi:MAG: hypothetical protein Q3980_06910 [Turicibacter sp.]|nr:hypothetical protein [Turicibacter sp.]MDO4925377.1 hypothetical protein [Turicibacter sp.]
MKKVKVEDMKVNIIYSEDKIDTDSFYDIVVSIIKRLEKDEIEGGSNEKKCSLT